MKTKLPLIAALYCGLSATGSAFTLDFIGFEGSTLPPNPLVVPVAGYGTVSFEAGVGSSLIVNSQFEDDFGRGTPSLTFTEGDAVKVTFNDLPPINVEFAFVGVSAGEAFTVQQDLFTPQAFLVTLQGSGNGAGMFSITFDAIPEPTSALLGTIGAALLVLRRRR